MTVIRYHTWWPSQSDPYYQYNRDENGIRNNYYANNFTPHLYLDGNIDAGFSYDEWSDDVQSRLSVESPLLIRLHCSFDSATGLGVIDIVVYAESDPGSDPLSLRVALTESELFWTAPNGLGIHNQVLRDMIPSSEGEPFVLSQGQYANFSYNYSISEPLAFDKCELVVFVQNDATRSILQSNKVPATGNAFCNFVAGDANDDNQMSGLDVIYAVNFLKGIGNPPPQVCECPPYTNFLAAADANGDCTCNGIDVIYSVNFLKGLGPSLRRCFNCFDE